MRKRASSKTAELAVMIRILATHSKFASGVMNDSYARYFPGLSTLVPYTFNRMNMFLNPNFWRVGLNSVGFLIALCRHRYMSDLIMKSLEKGIRQVVLVGAGYDTNFLRIPPQFSNVSWFEIDHPNTQCRKLRIINKHSLKSAVSVKYIELDLENEGLDKKLTDSGLDSNKAVLVLAEGILSYLSSNSLDRLFKTLLELSDEVRFAADFRFLQMDLKDAPFTIRRWRNEFKMMNETYRSFFSGQEVEQKLGEHGFDGTEHFNLVELWKEYTDEHAPQHLSNIGGLFVTTNSKPDKKFHSVG